MIFSNLVMLFASWRICLAGPIVRQELSQKMNLDKDGGGIKNFDNRERLNDDRRLTSAGSLDNSDQNGNAVVSKSQRFRKFARRLLSAQHHSKKEQRNRRNPVKDFPSAVDTDDCSRKRATGPHHWSRCQHIHVHLNNTRSNEQGKGWQWSLLSILIFMAIIIIFLNCLHYYFELGGEYAKNYRIGGESDDEHRINLNRGGLDNHGRFARFGTV